MVYFIKTDLLARIKEANLDIILDGLNSTPELEAATLTSHELDAVNTVSSYLSHEYDNAKIFQPRGTEGYTIDPTIARCVLDVMLYNLHNSRVNPRNIPENIIARRDDAIMWLKDIANPRTNTKASFLPSIEYDKDDKRNNELAYGSRTKQNNYY